MKALFAASLLALSLPLAAAECSYPLNATQAEFSQLPFLDGWLRAPSVSGQSIEFPLAVPANGMLTRYGAFSSLGISAMSSSWGTATPSGDVSLPASGHATIEMRIDSFPWTALSLPAQTAGLTLTVLTGNQQNTLEKTSLQLNAVVINSSNMGSGNFSVSINAEAVDNGNVQQVNRNYPFTPPVPVQSIGFRFNMDTREVGMSGDGTQYEIIRDTTGNPLRLPEGVTSVALGLGGYLFNINPAEPLIGTPLGATLITTICANSNNGGPLLPNGKPFPGKGKALGLQK